MSIESAEAFVERMKTDESFATKVAECKDNEARIALVKTEGFEFTTEEFKTVGAELSEDELDKVSGGEMKFEYTKGEWDPIKDIYPMGYPQKG